VTNKRVIEIADEVGGSMRKYHYNL